MEVIKREDVEQEIEELTELLSGYSRVNEKVEKLLEDRGYTLETLGSGSSAHTSSLFIGVKNITSRKYLNGDYLVVGVANFSYNMNTYYRGYCKEII